MVSPVRRLSADWPPPTFTMAALLGARRKGPQGRVILEQLCPPGRLPPQACNQTTPPQACNQTTPPTAGVGACKVCKVLRPGVAERTPQCSRELAVVAEEEAEDVSTGPESFECGSISYTECRQSIWRRIARRIQPTLWFRVRPSSILVPCGSLSALAGFWLPPQSCWLGNRIGP